MSWQSTIAGFVQDLAPQRSESAIPDDELLALGRELAACTLAEGITADARLAAWRRSHG